ncbi:hypothetical protein PV08_01527 [Exophiala spinifera]|uniref:Uncharacterized protein n=1 Tax=Exophiala spinifera TaxID=91928 RepID=A0A0D2BPQ8_9EURO|nr:uncharacterized protein PV08_01527 [Exophiala spinifera]KIW20948.1 hypothetical protein PV08_01527 [Exophiala spinifera]
MRALWAQLPRPRLSGCPRLRLIETTTPLLVRKTTTAPLRRRPTFNDVFTIFLAPVLAAVLIVDTSWKAKQRKDWDDKLFGIQEEIKEINERERRIRNVLQLRGSHGGLSHQRRGYSTAARARVDAEERFDDEVDVPLWEEDEEDRGPNVHNSGLRSYAKQMGDLKPAEVYENARFSPAELAGFQRYHRLNAIMLSLRLLLHLQVGPSPFFSLVPGEDAADPENVEFSQDSNRLIEMLRMTRKEMKTFRRREDLLRAAPRIEAQASRSDLNSSIRDLTAAFRAGNINVVDLTNRFGQVLLESTDVLSVSSYINLIRSFSTNGNYSLAYYVIAALKKSMLPLNDDAVFYILLQIGQVCDSRSLNHILPEITRSDTRVNVVSKWKIVHANGLDLPVPASLNVRLLQVLIYAALRCEQPERAEGWLSLLREMDYGAFRKNHLFRSFLTYYTRHSNWEKGQIWLRRSIEHASTIAAYTYKGFVRLIYRMLDLCVTCRKLPEYTIILDAAIKSGISPPLPAHNPNMRKVMYARGCSILNEWASLPISEEAISLKPVEKVEMFVKECSVFLNHISEAKKSASDLSEQNDDGDLVFVPSTRQNSLRYAVRRQLKSDQPTLEDGTHSSEMTIGEHARINSRFLHLNNSISHLKASVDIAEARYKAALEANNEQADTITQLALTASELRGQLQKVKDSERDRAKRSAELETELREKLNVAERERAQVKAQMEETVAGFERQLQESRALLKHMQHLNQSSIEEQAQLRKELSELRAITKRSKEQQPQQQQNSRTQLLDNTHTKTFRRRSARDEQTKPIPATRPLNNISETTPNLVNDRSCQASGPGPNIRFAYTTSDASFEPEARHSTYMRLKLLHRTHVKRRQWIPPPSGEDKNLVSPNVHV